MREFFFATVVIALLVAASGLPGSMLAAQNAHREKRGPCKKLEDLKKISGLDYRKIEARKERLACM